MVEESTKQGDLNRVGDMWGSLRQTPKPYRTVGQRIQSNSAAMPKHSYTSYHITAIHLISLLYVHRFLFRPVFSHVHLHFAFPAKPLHYSGLNAPFSVTARDANLTF